MIQSPVATHALVGQPRSETTKMNSGRLLQSLQMPNLQNSQNKKKKRTLPLIQPLQIDWWHWFVLKILVSMGSKVTVHLSLRMVFDDLSLKTYM